MIQKSPYVYAIVTLQFFTNLQSRHQKNFTTSVDINKNRKEFSTNIKSDSLDELIKQGIQHIIKQGLPFTARAGSGQQAYTTHYIVRNPNRLLHLIRKEKAIPYFCRALLAYFKGSLYVHDGLLQASKFWGTKDFPCTIGLQFFIVDHELCCCVSSRSTDIFTGLPYDMGFFALITQLVYQDLKKRLPQEISKHLKLGYVMMKTNFTQIYDKTRKATYKVLKQPILDHDSSDTIPPIENAQASLQDIYNQTANTTTMKWIYNHANFASTKK